MALRPAYPNTRILEFVGVGALATVAVTHLVDLAGTFAEVPYSGVGYVLLIAGAIVSIGLLTLETAEAGCSGDRSRSPP